MGLQVWRRPRRLPASMNPQRLIPALDALPVAADSACRRGRERNLPVSLQPGYFARMARSRRAENAAAGLCIDGCGNPSTKGSGLCDSCAASRTSAHQRYRARLMALGLCGRGCGRKNMPGLKNCGVCLAKLRDRRRKHNSKT